ncbi:hypothetical protein J6590_045654 [Homalodisca vitripennis]|nr:hypothetical protein J6590_045654 [Homalodisca vitripennis]
MAGRAGNDLASAFYKILETVMDENDITDLVTWSDSMDISEAKKKDIKAAFPYMPLQDRDYYKAVLNL